MLSSNDIPAWPSPFPGELTRALSASAVSTDTLLFAAYSVCAVALIVMTTLRHGTRTRTAVLAAALTAMTVIAASVLTEASGKRAHASMRRPLEGMAPTYAAELAANGHALLSSGADPDDPLYLTLIEMQKRWLDVNHSVADIYTFRKDAEGRWCLIVDSETDYNRNGVYDDEREARTEIGEPYNLSGEELDRALAGEYVFMDHPETDRWGTWVSAFVPIMGPDGTPEAVLGVDFPAAQWTAAIAAARLKTLGYLAVIVTLINGAALLQTLHQRHMKIMAQAQRDLRAQAERLDAANAQLAAAKADAEAASRSKSEFLANMSHEIRTPMTAILGYADMLAWDGDRTQAPRSRLESIDTIKRNGEHLLAIINDILDLSKIEAGKLAIEKTSLNPIEIVHDVITLMDIKARAKSLDIAVACDTPLPQHVSSDPLRLRQILVNLVGNAIKFTETGSIIIRLSASAEARTLSIAVVDTGIGLTPAQIERLFTPFTQADTSTTRKYGGTGLGLQISQRLAGLLGGAITVTSSPGRGSTFTLTLDTGPLDGVTMLDLAGNVQCPIPPVLPGLQAYDQPAPSLAGVRILLAEDGPDNQRLITFHLTKAGAIVRTAANGRAALAALTTNTSENGPLADPPAFDLILTDMQMPEMDGYTLARTLRQRGCTLPIIALTAHAMSSDRQSCFDAGCDAYATKPIDKAALILLCQQAVSGTLPARPAHT